MVLVLSVPTVLMSLSRSLNIINTSNSCKVSEDTKVADVSEFKKYILENSSCWWRRDDRQNMFNMIISKKYLIMFQREDQFPAVIIFWMKSGVKCLNPD